MDCMLLSLGLDDLRSRLAFARQAATDFQREQQFSTDERRHIGQIYAVSGALPVADGQPPERTDIRSASMFATGIPRIREFWQAFLAVPARMTPQGIYSVQWSLVHMRMNRLFDRDARLQEAIVWELLKRTYAAAVSRGG